MENTAPPVSSFDAAKVVLKPLSSEDIKMKQDTVAKVINDQSKKQGKKKKRFRFFRRGNKKKGLQSKVDDDDSV